MRSRFDHHEIVTDEEGSGRLGQVAGQGRHLAGSGVVPAHRPVVRVEYGDRAVGEDGDAERVLQSSLRGRTVDVAEVEQPGADGGGDGQAGRVVRRS
jgi:hypothetical protein